MTNRDLFIKTYEAHLRIEEATSTIQNLGIRMDESVFTNEFYSLFDEIIPMTLSKEGMLFFYEYILFQNYSLEEVLDELENNFL